jgi:hypothetical protein
MISLLMRERESLLPRVKSMEELRRAAPFQALRFRDSRDLPRRLQRETGSTWLSKLSRLDRLM